MAIVKFPNPEGLEYYGFLVENKAYFIEKILALSLAGLAIMNIWFYGSIFARLRAKIEASSSIFLKPLKCPLCFSFHISYILLLVWIIGWKDYQIMSNCGVRKESRDFLLNRQPLDPLIVAVGWNGQDSSNKNTSYKDTFVVKLISLIAYLVTDHRFLLRFGLKTLAINGLIFLLWTVEKRLE